MYTFADIVNQATAKVALDKSRVELEKLQRDGFIPPPTEIRSRHNTVILHPAPARPNTVLSSIARSALTAELPSPSPIYASGITKTCTTPECPRRKQHSF